MEELLEKLAGSIVANVEGALAAKLRSEFESLFRAQMKCVYTEDQAAEFLGVTVPVLAGWRKRGLITYARYPIGRLREGHDHDTLGDTYTYSLADLVSFRERYVHMSEAQDRFEIDIKAGVTGLSYYLGR